ncbi:hypothetical protein [Xenorhabdus bovienii]|uniref:hypothetical protein n=1 Tax=Xenorhabdus bovienii TaxID=40576 RepID=UPI0018AFD93F|nr:hypothetical protein [Xenorhabdus bovienii]
MRLKQIPLKMAFHTPCHMEKMGWAAYSIELTKRIPGVEGMRQLGVLFASFCEANSVVNRLTL